ncbi:MAG: Na+/H+-dicarboxylate symporter, partial [Kiritimatiellia bacterium]
MQLHTKILIGMAVGLVLGLAVGPNSPVLPHDGARVFDNTIVVQTPGSADPVALSQTLEHGVVVGEQQGWLQVEWTLRRQQLIRLQADGVAEAKSVSPGHTTRGWVPDREEVVERYSTVGQMLVNSTEWIGRLFLALIKMVVVPLVFLSLVVGIASLGDLRALGRMGLRTMGFFGLSTLIALIIGVTATNVLRPGAWLAVDDRERLLRNFAGAARDKVSSAADAPAFIDQLIGIVPQNPIDALASGDMLQIITFATLLGVALTFLGKERARPVVDIFDRLNDAMVMLVHIAMALAPFGVGALLFKV